MSRKTKNTAPSVERRNKIDPLKISMGRGFFILNAVFWLAYGVYVYYDMAIVNNNKSSADIVTLYIFINSGLLFFSGIKLGKPQKWTYFFTLGVLILNSVLSLLNIVDLFFMLSFFFDLFILWAVIPLRRQYFPKS